LVLEIIEIKVREGGLFGGHYLEHPDETMIVHESDRFLDCPICRKLGYIEAAERMRNPKEAKLTTAAKWAELINQSPSISAGDVEAIQQESFKRGFSCGIQTAEVEFTKCRMASDCDACNDFLSLLVRRIAKMAP
jgi:hypothetical protein